MSGSLKLLLVLVFLTAIFHIIGIYIIGESPFWSKADYLSLGFASLSLITLVGEARRERHRWFLPFKEDSLRASMEDALRMTRRERTYLDSPWTVNWTVPGGDDDLLLAKSWIDEVIKALETGHQNSLWKQLTSGNEIVAKLQRHEVIEPVRAVTFWVDNVNKTAAAIEQERSASSVKGTFETIFVQVSPFILLIALAIGITTITARNMGLDSSVKPHIAVSAR